MADEKEKDVITSPKLPERGPTERGKRQLDEATTIALRRRIEAAKRDGAVNISVGVDFLLELLNGTQQAMRGGFKSHMEV